MNIRFLRHMDRLFGPLLLLALAPLAKAIALLLPAPTHVAVGLGDQRYVFLKLKGGGSLIVALPALLAMRRAAPEASFTLVCTQETKIYAELTGVFDNYAVIADGSLVSLIKSSQETLKQCLRADICIDLEPNSILAAVFTILTLAKRRLGLVKPDDRYRALAYTDALAFNVFAPIYIYYDQLADLLNAKLYSIAECREHFLKQIPAQEMAVGAVKRIGISAFTSDFAPERMMPTETWADLLKRHIGFDKAEIVLFGSDKNKNTAEAFVATLRRILPDVTIINECGKGSLAEAIARFKGLNEFWAIDSGLLHIARLLGLNCRSFWGPTNPSQRLRPMEGVDEVTFYHRFVCSPCVHLQSKLPCKGNNLCMKTMAESNPNRTPVWLL